MDVLLDLRDPKFQADPYPTYRRLREEAPVHALTVRDRDAEIPIVVLSRWADCLAVLRDPRFSAVKDFARMMGVPSGDTAGEEAPVLRFFQALMLFRDPPGHTRLRTLVNKAFTPSMVERLRARVQEIVDELLDAAGRDGGMDLIHDLAAPLPVRVIAELMGVPPEDHAQLKIWSDGAAILLDGSLREANQDEAVKNLLEFAAYLKRIIDTRRSELRDDLISALVAAQAAGDVLDDVEILATCLLILGAGHETTTNLIGNGVLALLDHPGELRHLQRDPRLIRSAVEELLRYDSPVQVTSRIPGEDVEIRGHPIAAGIEVNVLIGSANRDPEPFREPDALRLGRTENRHLSFGHGVHFCLGAPLARLEGQLAIGTLVRRFQDLALASQPKRRMGLVLRGLESLPLRF